MMGRQARKRLLETDSREDWALVGEILDLTGLSPLRKQGFITLSGGEKQRVLIARALAQQTAVLVLDEPVDGLDPVMRRQVWSLLMGDVAEHGTTVLVSSHNLRELEDVCDHVGILSHGSTCPMWAASTPSSSGAMPPTLPTVWRCTPPS